VAPVAPRNVNDVSYVRRSKHASHFAWQAQYLVRLEGDTCCSAIVNDMSYVTRIEQANHFVWQVQYLVRLEVDTCSSAHCK